MFRVRSITVSATGREIVRETPVAGETLTIGRAPENDVVLPDLAARPTHARVIARGSEVAIEADAATVIAGKRRERYDSDVAAPVEIVIGDHTIVLAREGDDMVATVTRAEEPAVDDARAFSLAGRLPGKRASAWIAVVAVLALFLAWPVWSYFHPATIGETTADASWSPGALSRAHAGLEKNCKGCHTNAFVAVQDASCKACHKSVHDHADPAKLMRARALPGGLAGFKRAVATTFGRTSGRCVDCHQEHLGPTEMARTQDKFCADCHADLDARLTDSKLGDASDFAKVHPQFHPLVASAGGFRRIDFEAKPREDSGLKFPHALHLSRTGGVARMAQTLGQGAPACADCHTRDKSGAGFRPVEMEKNCGACHSLAYDRVGGTVRTLRHGDVAQALADLAASRGAGAFDFPGGRMRPGGKAASIGIAPGMSPIRALFGPDGACADCHIVRPDPKGGGGMTVAPVRQQARYLTRGWFDHDAHEVTKCATCHTAAASKSSSDFLIPGIATCRQCHGGEAARAPKVASGCAMCHAYHPVAGAPPDSRHQPHAPLKLAWRD